MRNDKIVLTSKSRLDTKVRQRRPVKECYCISETPARAEPLDHFGEKKNGCEKRARELVEIFSCEAGETGKSSLVATLLGCETLRRAGRLTYVPNSEFLRRVQRKVNCQGRRKPGGLNCDVSSSRSSGESEETMRNKKTIASEIVNCEGSKKNGGIESWAKGSSAESGERSSKSGGTEKKVERARDSKSGQKVGEKWMKNSGDVVDKGKSRKIVRTISTQSRCCSGAKKDSKRAEKGENIENKRKQLERISYEGDCDCEIHGKPEMRQETRWRLSRDRMNSRTAESEERMRELSKFRRANYFETHGSLDTLVGSSRSSMMQQTIDPCELNDRLLAANLSGGKNVKRIHYYPSYVVRQEKQTDDVGYRKKNRSRSSCDLIGHVIDLGVLKIPCDFSNNFYSNCHKRRSEEND